MDQRFKTLWSSDRQDWRTPKRIYDMLNREFSFNFDPCPVDPQFDGLAIEWGQRSYVNPPYRDVAKWIRKGYMESLKGKLAVFLVAARTDTKWFHEIVLPYASEIRFIRGRLKFSGHKNSAPFPSAVIVFDGSGSRTLKGKGQAKSSLRVRGSDPPPCVAVDRGG